VERLSRIGLDGKGALSGANDAECRWKTAAEASSKTAQMRERTGTVGNTAP
jgi:hypothetical protein